MNFFQELGVFFERLPAKRQFADVRRIDFHQAGIAAVLLEDGHHFFRGFAVVVLALVQQNDDAVLPFCEEGGDVLGSDDVL